MAGRLRRWTHRRALTAVVWTLLAASAIVYATRRTGEEPYTPGSQVEGVTNVHLRDVSASGWTVRYVDVAASSGLAFRHFSAGPRSTQLPEDMGSGCAAGDYDGDGDWDLFVADVAGPLGSAARVVADGDRSGCRLFRNEDGAFLDVTRESGLRGLQGTFMGGTWGDYDNDGFPDLVVTSYGEIRLFHNRGDGTFEDVSQASGIGGRQGFWTGAVWGDADGDGLLDLYVCNYVAYRVDGPLAERASTLARATTPFTLNPESYPPLPNAFFRNEGNGRFREVAAEAGIQNADGRSLSATFADLNDDGRPDIYVANDVSEGALFLNAGDGLFTDAGHEAHVADYRGSMGIAVGDPDGDLDLDMFVSHWIAEANALYVNKKAGPQAPLDFEDASERLGLGQISTDDVGWGTAFLDSDGDGRLDLVVANGSTFEDAKDRRRLVPMPMRLFWNTGPKGFLDVAPASGPALSMPRVHRGLAVADFDGDRREEIAVVVHGGDLVLLKAEGGPPSHRVAFRVQGGASASSPGRDARPRSNRSGYGARLVLDAGGRKQVREIGASSSYLSQDAPEAVFGLGSTSRIDSLTVRWPSGVTTTLRDLQADRTYRLVEGESVAHDVTRPDARTRKLAFLEAYDGARAAAAAGRSTEAIAAYRKALELDSRHEDCLYSLGNLLLEAGDHAGARRALERLLAIDPESQRANGALGDLLADPGAGPRRDLSGARRHYEAAGRIYTEETGWLVRLGEVALASGDTAGAARAFRSVLTTNERSFQAHYFLGYLSFRDGDEAGARREFDAAFAALGPIVAPAPGEGDVKKARSGLPSRGAFRPHWALLARGPVRMETAYEHLQLSLR